MTMMICRAAAGLSGAWLLLDRQGNDWAVQATHSHLQSMVEGVSIKSDFTFTDRAVADAIATYADRPDQLEGLGLDSHTVILCPEGAPVENRWVTLNRVPITGAIVGTDAKDRFRPKPEVLKDQVANYFQRQQWRSFAPPRISERHEPRHQQPHRPAHARELLVRYGWEGRAIAPEEFAPLRPGPVVTDEMAAKRLARMPQNRAAAKRAKHAENAARFRIEAAERAKQREAAT